MKNSNIKYEVIREYRDKNLTVLDIAIRQEEFTRETIDRVARQLGKELRDRANVIVNIFDSEDTAINKNVRLSSRRPNSRVGRAIDNWYARYIRSRYAGLHELTIYPCSRQLLPQVISYA